MIGKGYIYVRRFKKEESFFSGRRENLDKSADSEQLKKIKCCNNLVLSIQTAIQETCKALDFYSHFKTEKH